MHALRYWQHKLYVWVHELCYAHMHIFGHGREHDLPDVYAHVHSFRHGCVHDLPERWGITQNAARAGTLHYLAKRSSINSPKCSSESLKKDCRSKQVSQQGPMGLVPFPMLEDSGGLGHFRRVILHLCSWVDIVCFPFSNKYLLDNVFGQCALFLFIFAVRQGQPQS